MKQDIFTSPSKGEMDISQVAQEISEFINHEPGKKYQLFVGSDSNGSAQADFVAAIIIYRVGNGACYFWRKYNGQKPKFSLQERIHREVTISLEVARKLLAELESIVKTGDEMDYDFQIHIDVGQNGPTSKMIKEVVGMVTGNGFKAAIKPEAYAASNVADKYI